MDFQIMASATLLALMLLLIVVSVPSCVRAAGKDGHWSWSRYCFGLTARAWIWAGVWGFTMFGDHDAPISLHIVLWYLFSGLYASFIVVVIPCTFVLFLVSTKEEAALRNWTTATILITAGSCSLYTLFGTHGPGLPFQLLQESGGL